MKKIYLILIISLSTISCTLFYSKTNDLNINGKVKKLTKLKLNVLKDSLNNIYYDTLSIEVTHLNRKGKLKKRISKLFFKGDLRTTGIADFEYNDKGQLTIENYYSKEDSMTFRVYYHYKDTLISKIQSLSFLETEKIEYIENYYYRSNNNIDFREMRNLGIDTISKDTIYSQLAIFKHDINGYLIESDWTNLNNDFNKKEIFTNDNKGFMKKEISINRLTNKIDTTRFEYELDNNDNWIIAKSFKNDSLIQITKRIIE